MRIPHAESVTPGRTFIDLGPEFAAAILRTVAAGWREVRHLPDVHPNTLEVPITERLRVGMRDALRRLPWGKKMVVLPGTESRSHLDVLIPDGRTDIPLLIVPVYERTSEHDPHAVIECKRIAGADTRLCREYVVQGIDRFSKEKYSENHAHGFMVGYVLSGTSTESADGVNKYLTQQERLDEKLELSNACDDVESWRSEHPRPVRTQQIELLHLLLEFRAT